MKKSYGIKAVDVQCGDAKCSFYNIYRIDPSFTIEARDGFFHTHKHYECHLVDSGNYILETEHEKIQVPRQHLIIVPPGTGHFTHLSSDLRKYVLAFSLENVKSAQQGFYAIFKHLLESSALCPIDISEELLKKAEELQEIPIPVTAEDYCRCMSVATEGMTQLFSALNRRAESNMFNASIPFKEEFQALLDLYVGYPEYSMQDIAERLGYSPRHLARLIHSVYGMSLADLRNKQRCEEVKRLLRDTDKSVDRIAAEVGFRNSAAMREAFRRHEGTTPAGYRKNNKNQPSL